MVSKILGPEVLLVEKNNYIFEILKACIVTHNLRFSRAIDLEKEIPLILSHKYSLLIIDSNLSLNENILAIKKIKEHNILLPIIAIGPNNPVLEIQAYQLGVNIYHSKPIKCELLKAQIAQLTPSYQKIIILELGNIKIDVSSQAIYIHNQKIDFTYQEFYLLLLLIKTDGRVLSRSNISKYLFSSNKKDVSYAAIDTLVSRIRSKLNQYLEKPFIKTEYKLGYRINPVYLKTYHIKTSKS